MTMDLLTSDQLIDARDHVVALLDLDEHTVTPDERECLLGLDQRLERAIHLRAFGEGKTS
jgi:hypothetical protein